MADPEEKKDAAGSAEAEPAPKRRRRAPKPAKAAKAAKATKGKEEKRETPAVKAGQVHVYSLDGDVVKTIDLPTVFRSDIRLDLIRRAVTAFQANRRQAYGPGIGAGMRHSVRWSGKGHGVSRVPRLRGTMTGAQAPGTVGGRRAHPPRPDTAWAKKINEHERRLARNAALAALKDPQMVASRGHRFPDDVTLPEAIRGGSPSSVKGRSRRSGVGRREAPRDPPPSVRHREDDEHAPGDARAGFERRQSPRVPRPPTSDAGPGQESVRGPVPGEG